MITVRYDPTDFTSFVLMMRLSGVDCGFPCPVCGGEVFVAFTRAELAGRLPSPGYACLRDPAHFAGECVGFREPEDFGLCGHAAGHRPGSLPGSTTPAIENDDQNVVELWLTDAGPNRGAVVSWLRTVAGLSIREVAELLKQLPAKLTVGPRMTLDRYAIDLQNVGASARIVWLRSP